MAISLKSCLVTFLYGFLLQYKYFTASVYPTDLEFICLTKIFPWASFQMHRVWHICCQFVLSGADLEMNTRELCVQHRGGTSLLANTRLQTSSWKQLCQTTELIWLWWVGRTAGSGHAAFVRHWKHRLGFQSAGEKSCKPNLFPSPSHSSHAKTLCLLQSKQQRCLHLEADSCAFLKWTWALLMPLSAKPYRN